MPGSALAVYAHALRHAWVSTLVWTTAFVGAELLYLTLYPSIGGNGQLESIIDSLPSALVETLGFDQITSGAGYAQATFFGLLGFALLSICAVSWGTDAVAGDEERGTLELTLAHAVGRLGLAVARLLAVLTRLIVVAVVVAIVLFAIDGPAGLELGGGPILGMVGLWLGLGVFAACAAFGIGAITGRRSAGLIGGAAVPVVGYALNAVAGTNPDDFAWLRNVSPYSWMLRHDPLEHGWNWADGLLLYGCAALIAVVGTAVFTRRDIGR